MHFCFSVAAYFGGALEGRGRSSAPEYIGMVYFALKEKNAKFVKKYMHATNLCFTVGDIPGYFYTTVEPCYNAP